MDVTCPRCQTDYEFDDALVSDRGTTVKCTNCGHQFRVFRPRANAPTPAYAPELWRIERVNGETFDLRSLVELQRAIRVGRVTRDDVLRRGEGAGRRVGDITELEPFFPPTRPEGAATLPLPSSAAEHRSNPPPGTRRTLTHGERLGASEPPRGARTPAPPHVSAASGHPSYEQTPAPVLPPVREHIPTPLGMPAYRQGPSTQMGLAPPPGLAAAEPRDVISSRPPAAVEAQPTGRSLPPQAAAPSAAPASFAAPAIVPSSPVGPVHQAPEPRPVPPQRPVPPMRSSPPARSAASAPPSLPPSHPSHRPPHRPDHLRSDMGSVDGPDEDNSLDAQLRPHRRSLGYGLLATFVAGGALILLATVGRSWWSGTGRSGGGTTVGAAPNADEHLERDLSAARSAYQLGDLAAAKDGYQRATAADERSLPAWDGLCSAESELALAQWLTARTSTTADLVSAKATGESAGRACARWGELVRTTEDGLRRLQADLRPIRALAAQSDAQGLRLFLASHSGQPLLAALVLLADGSNRGASGFEEAARSAAATLASFDLMSATPSDLALVAYTSRAAGQSQRSLQALRALEERAPKHPALDALRALSPLAADAGRPTSAAVASTTASNGAGVAAGAGAAPAPAGDYRTLNEQGHRALSAGNLARAEAFFRASLAQHPGDVDALFGLGETARSRGDHAGAISYFHQVLASSAGFAPARLALADEQWAQGQRAEAAHNYELYLDRVADGPGADRARSRTSKATPEKGSPDKAPADPPAERGSGATDPAKGTE